jgi:hypothetical protein
MNIMPSEVSLPDINSTNKMAGGTSAEESTFFRPNVGLGSFAWSVLYENESNNMVSVEYSLVF